MTQSHHLFNLAKQHIPGGVNSPVRAFGGVGGEPVFIKQADGAYLIDADGKRYIDYVASFGPMIVGHTHPDVLAAMTQAMKNGSSFGAPTELEVSMAERVCQLVPSIQQIRFVNSGTEATMSAIRLARGYTGRDKIIKFSGCYHGHADSLLVSAGSGLLTFAVPSSKGVPDSVVKDTLVADYNDLTGVADLFARYGEEIACVIVEPVAGNMNCILPKNGFLQGLRQLCDQYQSILIFDEVMTGFRVALGGAQAYFDVKPDLTTLGKVIGGGLPVGAFGGRADIMACLAPLGPVYQAGTLSGNPLAMAGGLATLSLIAKPGFYQKLTEHTQQLIFGLQRMADGHGIPFFAQSIGGMFGLFFTQSTALYNEQDVKQCSIVLFKQFFHGMLQRGVYFAPSAFEAGFLSSAHSVEVIEQTINAADHVFAHLKSSLSM